MLCFWVGFERMNSNLLYYNIRIQLSSYLKCSFTNIEITEILKELNLFFPDEMILEETEKELSYSDLEEQLFNINEKQVQRKEKGVYYTDNDVTEFIIDECISHKDEVTFLLSSIFDPTCGSGEFLITALKKKITINTTISDKRNIKDADYVHVDSVGRPFCCGDA